MTCPRPSQRTNNMDKYKTQMTIKKWFSFINSEKLSGKSQKAVKALMLTSKN